MAPAGAARFPVTLPVGGHQRVQLGAIPWVRQGRRHSGRIEPDDFRPRGRVRHRREEHGRPIRHHLGLPEAPMTPRPGHPVVGGWQRDPQPNAQPGFSATSRTAAAGNPSFGSSLPFGPSPVVIARAVHEGHLELAAPTTPRQCAGRRAPPSVAGPEPCGGSVPRPRSPRRPGWSRRLRRLCFRAGDLGLHRVVPIALPASLLASHAG